MEGRRVKQIPGVGSSMSVRSSIKGEEKSPVSGSPGWSLGDKLLNCRRRFVTKGEPRQRGPLTDKHKRRRKE